MKLSEVRTNLKTLAEGVDSLRADLGYTPTEPTDEFIRDIIEDGPYIQILGGSLAGTDEQTGLPRYRIPCKLWFGIARYAANDLTTIEDVLDDLRLAFHPHVISMTWDAPQYDELQSPLLGSYDVSVEAFGCPVN